MSGVLSWVLAVGGVGLAGILVALHVVRTGLRPSRDPVSQYALTRYGYLYRAATVVAGVTGAAAALLFATQFTGVAAVVSSILLAVFVVSRLVIGFFAMDAPDAPKTGTGRLHNVLAFSAFGSVTAAAFVAAGALHDAGFQDLATLSTALGILMGVGSVGLLFTAKRGLFGLSERLIYIGFIVWFVALGVAGIIH